MRRFFVAILLISTLNTSAYGQGMQFFPYVLMQYNDNASCVPAFDACRSSLNYASETMRMASEGVVDFCRRTPRCLSRIETRQYQHYFNESLRNMLQCVCRNGCREFKTIEADRNQPIAVITQTVNCSQNGW